MHMSWFTFSFFSIFEIDFLVLKDIIFKQKWIVYTNSTYMKSVTASKQYEVNMLERKGCIVFEIFWFMFFNLDTAWIFKWKWLRYKYQCLFHNIIVEFSFIPFLSRKDFFVMLYLIFTKVYTILKYASRICSIIFIIYLHPQWFVGLNRSLLVKTTDTKIQNYLQNPKAIHLYLKFTQIDLQNMILAIKSKTCI